MQSSLKARVRKSGAESPNIEIYIVERQKLKEYSGEESIGRPLYLDGRAAVLDGPAEDGPG
jgi:hypothetical protein